MALTVVMKAERRIGFPWLSSEHRRRTATPVNRRAPHRILTKEGLPMADTDPRATIIDGKAFAAGLVERVAAASARLEAAHGIKPGLAVVIVGEDPASQIYVRNKGETTQRGRHALRHPSAAGHDEPGRAAGPDRDAERRPGHPRHPGPAAPARADRLRGGPGRHRPGQGRRRLPRRQRRPAGRRPAGAGPLHARWARPCC